MLRQVYLIGGIETGEITTRFKEIIFGAAPVGPVILKIVQIGNRRPEGRLKFEKADLYKGLYDRGREPPSEEKGKKRHQRPDRIRYLLGQWR